MLGSSYGELSPLLERVHDQREVKRLAGRCDVRGGASLLAKALARIAGLPAGRSDLPVAVKIARRGDAEVWSRAFGTQRMRSVLSRRDGRLHERLGLIVLTFDLTAERDRITWSFRGASFAGLPLSWLVSCEATETIEQGRYCFDVSGRLRGAGLLVHYRGWLAELDPG